MIESDVKNWTCDDVRKWLYEIKYEKYVALFCDDHKIDGEALLVLTENDLRQPPLQIRVLGDIKRLGIALRRLQISNNHACDSFDGQETSSKMSQTPSDPESNSDDEPVPNGGYAVSRRRPSRNVVRANGHVVNYTSLNYHGDINPANNAVYIDNNNRNTNATTEPNDLPPELWKTLLSFFYAFNVLGLTSFIMVIVHDRVPDMDKYPPLPDLFLDNMPYVPWAFECCELIAILMTIIAFTILFFHKHRFILLRRSFSLTGTVFLLRGVSMLITSMSVPGIHISCHEKTKSDAWSKLERTFVIWFGCGMTLRGVRSCGDYMFSGHTVAITLLNFFITEYTPQVQMYFLHTVSWVLNLFGIFFILAAHEHYSIDVFIAFYITSRLFLYYHTLANNRAFIEKRAKIWFPLFSFFESKCNGAVPNEYEWPLPWPQSFKSYFENTQKNHNA